VRVDVKRGGEVLTLGMRSDNPFSSADAKLTAGR
jgi:hypothetical protein